MIDNYRVGNHLTFLRREKGLTGEKFAEQLGVSPQAVSKWENGKCLPETALLPAVSALLGASIDSILTPPNITTKKYGKNELYRYDVARRHAGGLVPQIFKLDFESNTIAMEDMSGDYVSCRRYDEDSADGAFVRENLTNVCHAAADWHSSFWENHEAFGQIGLDWRFETRENMLAHISMLEKEFKKLKKSAEAGALPKVWEGELDGEPFRIENNIDVSKLGCFESAAELLRREYVDLIDTRFHAGKNVTVIHGDMNPSPVFISKANGEIVKFTGLQAVRMGLPAEDLAMLVALHLAPAKRDALPLLDAYYARLGASVRGYSRETFMSDYKLAVAENMFFPARLINRKIYAFNMLENAVRAFEGL